MPFMGDNPSGYDLKAPGRSGSSLRLPGRGPFPGLDDRLVEPEVTRDEVVGGHRVVAFPAEEPHATQHTELDYVLRAHRVPGYHGATDLLTRHDEKSDFASDTCLYKQGVDPETGGRYLEEIAFEVVAEQNRRLVTEKAVRMYRRGVRRIFTIWVKDQQVCEWSPESHRWRPLDCDSQIEDPCLVRPLAVAALLDAALADDAVAEALIAKGNPVILGREAKARSEGRVEAGAEAILKVLAARSITVSEAQRQEILQCADPARLDRWLLRSAVVSSTGEVMSEP